MANDPDPRVWNQDLICDAELTLHQANHLWTEQSFCGPSPERTAEIRTRLADAQERIAEVRAKLGDSSAYPMIPPHVTAAMKTMACALVWQRDNPGRAEVPEFVQRGLDIARRLGE